MRRKHVINPLDHRKEPFASRARRPVLLCRCEDELLMTVGVVEWAVSASSCCELASATDLRVS